MGLPLFSATFALGPLFLRVLSAENSQQERLAKCWRELFCIYPFDGFCQHTDITIQLERFDQSESPPEPLQELNFSNPVHIQPVVGGFRVIHTAASFHIEWKQSHVAGVLTPNFWDYPIAEQREFFHKVFFLVLRRQNTHLLHANGVIAPTHGVGVLLIGGSGAGKTTLGLSLIQAGWHYVSDDTVMLHGYDTGLVNAYAFRQGFSCTAQTASYWPKLVAKTNTGIVLNRGKGWLDIQSLYPKSFVSACQPRLLLFLRRTEQYHSRLISLDVTQTFTAMLDQPHAGILIEHTKVGSLMTCYQTLVRQSRGFYFDAGQDVLDRPDRITALLETVLPDR